MALARNGATGGHGFTFPDQPMMPWHVTSLVGCTSKCADASDRCVWTDALAQEVAAESTTAACNRMEIVATLV